MPYARSFSEQPINTEGCPSTWKDELEGATRAAGYSLQCHSITQVNLISNSTASRTSLHGGSPLTCRVPSLRKSSSPFSRFPALSPRFEPSAITTCSSFCAAAKEACLAAEIEKPPPILVANAARCHDAALHLLFSEGGRCRPSAPEVQCRSICAAVMGNASFPLAGRTSRWCGWAYPALVDDYCCSRRLMSDEERPLGGRRTPTTDGGLPHEDCDLGDM